MTGGGASWQPGSADWSVLAWLTAGHAFLEWSCTLRSIKTSQLITDECPSGPDQATQVSQQSHRLMFFFFLLKWNPYHRRTKNLSGCFHRSRACMTKCENCSPSVTQTLHCYVKESSRWRGNVATGFLPSGTLWWHHQHSNRAWPVQWGSSSESWMEHLGETLTVK